MNSNEKITTIQKYAGIASKVLLAAFVIIILLIAVLIIAVLTVPATQIQQVLSAVQSHGGSVPSIAFLLIVLLIKTALYLVVLWIVRSILLDISRRSTPFESIHVKRMRRIALLIFIASFINTGIQIADWCVALVVWFLSMVFDYGCALQQESDETL